MPWLWCTPGYMYYNPIVALEKTAEEVEHSSEVKWQSDVTLGA
jgi:hypothetical protein